MTARYPLWCVDREDVLGTADESRYLGPFEKEQDARDDCDTPDQIRRCRRVMASEMCGLVRRHDGFIEELNEYACEGDLPDTAWADFTDDIIPGVAMADAFKAWLDAHLTVKAFVCEGDEPEPGGEG